MFKIAVVLCLAFPYLLAEDVACQKITLDDGRVLVGVYNAGTGSLGLIDEKSGRSVGSMSIDAAKVTRTEQVKVVVKAADPMDIRGINGKWITSYAAALKLAKEKERPILMLFTGSDWCPYCIKLEKEVLSTDKFKEWAKANVVLLYLDFPQNKVMAKDLVAQNEMLKAKFGNSGVPHCYFVNAKEEKSSYQGGYFEGGVEKWLAEVDYQRSVFLKKK